MKVQGEDEKHVKKKEIKGASERERERRGMRERKCVTTQRENACLSCRDRPSHSGVFRLRLSVSAPKVIHSSRRSADDAHERSSARHWRGTLARGRAWPRICTSKMRFFFYL